MRDEKLMILTMLEEGKITSQEAIKLLEALEETDYFMDYGTNEDEEKSINLEQAKENLIEALEKNIEDRKEKIENIGIDIGNKLANAFNNLFGTGNLFNLSGNYKVINTQLEKDISHLDEASLVVKSINGKIDVKSWGEDKLLIKITYRYKNNSFTQDNSFYELYEEDNRIIFKPLYTNNVMMDLSLYLPQKHYKEISLTTSNGRIQLEDLKLNLLTCNTSNASISLEDIVGENVDISTKNGKINLRDISSPILKAVSTNASIKLEDIESRDLMVATKNGRITLSHIAGEGITVKSSNGSIEADNLKGKVINLDTSNGKIICRDLDDERIRELNLSTSNSTIDVEMNHLSKMGYYQLETSLGNINLDIPGLVYKENKQIDLGIKKIIAHSINFNEDEEHFILNASTSNGSIKIR
ncbi:MAG: DUF4097 domain-containing protein [Tissierellia bacterium]|nr:DUF4097 domain-containing protein [Tissierellia bacterium]